MKKHFLLLWMLISCLGGVATAQTVYITAKGQKYHSTNCRFLNQSKKAIDLPEAKRMGYTACKTCKAKPTQKTNKQKNIEQDKLYGMEVLKEESKVFKNLTRKLEFTEVAEDPVMSMHKK